MGAPSWEDSESSASPMILFGPFALDVRSAELRKGGLRVRLQDQPFKILVALLERPGEVVLREELRQTLWPDNTVVEFDHSINAAVKRLRDALRDSAESPRYIETLPKRGYRFIGELNVQSRQPVPTEPEMPADLIAAAAPEKVAPPVPGLPSANAIMPPPAARRSLRLIAILLLVSLAISLAAGWLYWSHRRARWAREIAFPEATRLIDAGKYAAAFPLLYQAWQTAPADPALTQALRGITHATPIRTTPPGANVYLKPYDRPDSEWLFIGTSPLEQFPLAMGYYRWKITKPGFQTVETGNGIQISPIEFVLDREGTVPAEMVHIPRGDLTLFDQERVRLDDFWMDKYEVTNRQFKEFVDQGGYRNQRYWREEFRRDGRVLSWDQAMAQLRDATDRPGPSTWEVGSYPPGQEDFPVSGVSWYEAMAYAAFAGKELPTVFHWYRAAQQELYSDILLFSNYDAHGPVRVGSLASLGAAGTYDMAGNVSEWCLNATGSRRYLLGGGWNQPRISFARPDAFSPFDRSRTNGFRCVKYIAGRLTADLARPVQAPSRDYRVEKPLADDAFEILRGLYAYDHTPLNARVERQEPVSPDWRVEKISLDAAYGHEQMAVWLYLPARHKPPFQTVIYAPGGHARVVDTIDAAEVNQFSFLLRSGRAVLLPVYQGTFSRRNVQLSGPNGARDRTIQQSKDLQRAVDYLETRPDIASHSLGFYGISAGARQGLIALALEPRIGAAVLAEAGLPAVKRPPEIDEMNFAPRVHSPVLMLNGRYDFMRPVDASQLPLFHLLGASQKDKRLFDSGHYRPAEQYIKEALDWFDWYLGTIDK